MQYQYSPYMVPLLLAGLLSAWAALYVWRHRATRSAPALILLAVAITIWSWGYALEIAGTDLATKILWGKFQYIGIVFVPVFWFVFAYNHSHPNQHWSHRNMLLLLAIPLSTLLLVFTTDLHGLIWDEIGTQVTGDFSALSVTRGWWFWVHSVYSYALLLAGTLYILRMLRRQGLYRGQAIVLLIAVLIPWIGNILFLTGLSPLPYLDPTPFAFTLTLLALIWGIFGFSLIDLSPIARDTVMEKMSDGMLVLDAQNRVADINSAAQDLLETTAAQAVGQPIGALLARWPHLIHQYSAVQETLDEITFGQDQDQRWYEVRIAPLTDNRKRLLGRVVTVRNITGRKRMESALRESEERYRNVAESMTDVVWLLDVRSMRFTYVSPSVARLRGYTAAEVMAQPLAHAVTAESLTFIQTHLPDNIAAYLAGDKTAAQGVTEVEQPCKDGGTVWTEVVTVLQGDAESGLKVLGVSRDISERKRADEQIRQLSRAVEASPTSIVITDLGGNIQYVNPKFTEVTGYSAQEAYGQNPRILKSDRTPREVYQDMWQTLRAGQAWHGEFCNRKKSGEFYWELASISPIPDAAGNVTHYVAVKEDITELKRTQEELSVARDLALAASRYKTELLAKVSHELRTPLGAILGYTEFLHNEMFAPLTPQQKHFTTEILDSVNYLNGLVNDLLDESQIERGQIQIRAVPFDPYQMADQISTRLRPAAESKGLTFNVAVSPALPATIEGDQKRIRQILTNLINNAIKFTAAGAVNVTLDRRDTAHWCLQVSDTGPGIAPEVQEKIFEAFWQADGSVIRYGQGYGLGLSIVKQLTELMGGEVKVDSQVGQGSTFTVTLPLAK
jgi:PAS domain S-box-containing protein